MKKFLIVILCFFTLPSLGSHIVGGEFELLYESKNHYLLRLLYYFDVLNNQFANPPQSAQPELSEPAITVAIFRKSDNKFMRFVTLSFTSKERVDYTQPDCSKGEVVTDRMVYSAPIELSDADFGDPKGYYVVWERCCRNYTITNIISDPPPPGDANFPNAAGQTFYLEFPPVVKDGVPFVNSSPRLFPPLNDYACPNKPYYADFQGTDDDGDSLVYSLAVPLSTHTTLAEPQLMPAPFPTVKWQSPFSFNNILAGDPDLKISTDGLLTVTPTVAGLFVFAVRCDEFRNGVKIGEVRRDFQMLVVNGCSPATAPRVRAKKLNESIFHEGDVSVSFSNQVPDDQRCIEIYVSDDDVLTDSKEQVKIRAIPLGFKQDLKGILPAVTSATLTTTNSETVFRICFEECPYFENGVFQIAIIASDDACALPLLDTIKISVYVQPPDNAPPFFSTANVNTSVDEGAAQTWPVIGIDPDNDSLTVNVVTDGFIFEDRGFSFQNVLLADGNYQAQLKWDALCHVYDFTDTQDFAFKIELDDIDDCQFNDADTMKFDLHVNLPTHFSPVIGTNLTSSDVENGIERNVFEGLDFTVFGSDQDNNPLTLTMTPLDFSADDFGISFPTVVGNDFVKSDFNWDILCEKMKLDTQDDFSFLFIVHDTPDKCGIVGADSLTVDVHVNPAINTKPELTVTNLSSDVDFENNSLEITMGQQIALNLLGEDHDNSPKDHVKVELIQASGSVEPVGYQFTPGEGEGSAQGTFTWVPECSVFENGVYENDYTFRFRTIDNRCFNAMADTVEVAMTIKDIDGSDTEFLPPNFITPNADGCNDFFGMEDLEDTACGEMHIPKLPKDNCIGKFASIRIYNRWGKQVFHSTKRNFRWHAEAEAAGVYFYTMQYTNTEYKGSVTVMY
jgi:hypothetical protein